MPLETGTQLGPYPILEPLVGLADHERRRHLAALARRWKGGGTIADALLNVIEQTRGGQPFNPPNEISVILDRPRLMKKN